MVYARRRNYNRSRRYGSRYSRVRRSNVRRRRFKRPFRSRNTVNNLTMRAQLAARQLRVKLPWAETFEFVLGTDNPAYKGLCYQGNGMFPYTTEGNHDDYAGHVNVEPSTGNIMPAGSLEYSRFYDKYVVNGSSISVEILNQYSPNSNPSLIRAVLLAVPWSNNGNGIISTGDDSWPGVRAQLDGYTYEQLLTWPHAKWRMVGANTGGASRVFFKMFRKTKHMCGIKDLQDDPQYQGLLQDGVTSVTQSTTSRNPELGFMYYLRMFNAQDGTDQDSIAQLTVKMSLYCTLFGREFNPTLKFT